MWGKSAWWHFLLWKEETQSSLCQKGPRTCVHLARTCLLGAFTSCEGNTVLWGHRSWNCELVGRCVLFLVHIGDSACFELMAVTCSSSSLCNENDIIMCSLWDYMYLSWEEVRKGYCTCLYHLSSSNHVHVHAKCFEEEKPLSMSPDKVVLLDPQQNSDCACWVKVLSASLWSTYGGKKVGHIIMSSWLPSW